MFYHNYWELLLVDDEPDVLAVSRLALKNLVVYGVPIKIQECKSKAEAIEFLKDPSTSPYIYLSLIDVVMETENAGLELCDFIRNELGNDQTQLVVRTGQAGIAPEQAVTDKYDINAYVTKVEATGAKLYAMVKTALRQSLYARTNELLLNWSRLLAEADTYDDLLTICRMALPAMTRDKSGRKLDSVEGHFAIVVDDDAVGDGRYESADAAKALRDELSDRPGKEMNPQRDLFIRDGKKFMLKLTPHPKHESDVSMVGEINFDPAPDYWVRSFLEVMRVTRGLVAKVPKS